MANQNPRTKYLLLAMTSVLIAVAVIDRLPAIAAYTGKADIPTIAAVLALILQVYLYYLGIAEAQAKILEERLRGEILEVETRLRTEALDRAKRYEQSVSGLDLRVNTRVDGHEKRTDYLEEAFRKLLIAQRIHEQMPGHIKLSEKVDELIQEVAFIKALAVVRGADNAVGN